MENWPSNRVLLVVPVEVAWNSKRGGIHSKETAETEEINAHGALLRMRAAVPIQTLVVLTHRKTRRTTWGRVVRTSPERIDGKLQIAVEVDEPSERFWGVTIPSTGN